METRDPMTALELLEDFQSGRNCHSEVSACKWNENGNTFCPYCKSESLCFIKTRLLWQCLECKKQFNIKTNTFMQDSHIDICKWCAVVFLVANEPTGVMDYETFKALNITQKSAWYMLHRIRITMMTPAFCEYFGRTDFETIFAGVIKRNWKAKNQEVATSQRWPEDNYTELLLGLLSVPHVEIMQQMQVYEETKHLRQPKRRRFPTEKQKGKSMIHAYCRNSKRFVLERPTPDSSYQIREATEEDYQKCQESAGKCQDCKLSCGRQLQER